MAQYDVEELLSMSEDQILDLIGQEIKTDDVAPDDINRMAFFVPGVSSLKEKALAWLNKNQSLIQDKICKDDELQKFAKENPNARVEIAKMIPIILADLPITGGVGSATAVTTLVGVFLVQKGLVNYCSSYWSD